MCLNNKKLIGINRPIVPCYKIQEKVQPALQANFFGQNIKIISIMFMAFFNNLWYLIVKVRILMFSLKISQNNFQSTPFSEYRRVAQVLHKKGEVGMEILVSNIVFLLPQFGIHNWLLLKTQIPQAFILYFLYGCILSFDLPVFVCLIFGIVCI